MKTKGRATSKNVKVQSKLAGRTRSVSYSEGVQRRKDSLANMIAVMKPLPKPKLDIGKKSVAGLPKAAAVAKKEEAGKNRRAKLVTAVAKSKKPVSFETVLRKSKAVNRTRKPGMASARRSLNK